MEIEIENNYIVFVFGRKIDYKLYSRFESVEKVESQAFNQLFLDFSQTSFITLPGIIYVLYFLNHLKKNKEFFETRLINIKANIARQLAKFGFLNSSITYGNLFLDSELEIINNRLMSNFSLENVNNQSSLYFPIKTLPKRSGEHFESDGSGFTNSFVDYFNLLDMRGEFEGLVNKELVKKKFTKAIYEIGKNIWEHSFSWGLAAIQSTESTGTSIAICDNGVGFIGSYKHRNPEYVINTDNNRNLIEWLIVEGNSSKGKNKNGHGLSRVFDFILEVKGTLLIKTDAFEITLKKDQEKPKIKSSSFFVGTQVFINF
ncbi:hypothetical protein [Xanthomarina gelatinilytica]|uniref:hypothetical protein n=1 Tax=Xanthomarina gelatinilytica TaxID=1137281 RepID=UPI003AA8DB76